MLASDHVHIWLARPEDCQDPALIATYLAWLDQEERDRYQRFRFDHHRHTFLVAHALLRSCLARYGHTQPQTLSLLAIPRGGPSSYPRQTYRPYDLTCPTLRA
ncbi:MAG: hypothetical protein HC929_08660 [Leptolyngbyaceae cyanobacterium SM2_5_2]|nr:hypothetical protein [Leptolyngbyaceae cyanobacterium SM2_5_2]